ncbi:hypothetical protein C7271_07150 [filamentous cyanobacterium CCP5]|nr:hypothetical protein C7271_07150 [filamentous cyanobacterium CCP5]
MTALSRVKSAAVKPKRRRRGLWFERIMALLAFTNLVLVAFDLSYIRFRDVYLRFLPEFTTWYGETFKGIEPERTTEAYLDTVDRLEEQVAQTGLQSIQAETLLAELRQQSEVLIDENPFEIADKSGTLERIKNEIRDRVDVDSSKDAFDTFWSQEYFAENQWSNEIAFFNQDVVPLIETNYYRRIGFDGGPLDWFWKIDMWFILIFAVELLARSFYISRKYKNFTLLDAIFARGTDLLLVIPFTAIGLPYLALLRIIPVTARLDQANLVIIQPITNRFNRFIISQVAIELTEVVILRVIDQVQNLIRQGDIARFLLATGSGRRYIDLNGVDEVQVLSQKATMLLVDQVLPLLKPEIDAILAHNVNQALAGAPGYQNLRQIPGMAETADRLSRELAAQVSASLYSGIQGSLQDEKGAQLMQQLVAKFGDSLRSEVQTDNTVQEVETLTIALLEEVKLNYVRQIAAEDYEVQEEKRYQLYDLSREGNNSN